MFIKRNSVITHKPATYIIYRNSGRA